MSNKRDLTYDDLTHPIIKDRIVLDYPLDVLLNRDCLLQDYEQGIMAALEEYNTNKNKLWNNINGDKDKLKLLQSFVSYDAIKIATIKAKVASIKNEVNRKIEILQMNIEKNSKKETFCDKLSKKLSNTVKTITREHLATVCVMSNHNIDLPTTIGLETLFDLMYTKWNKCRKSGNVSIDDKNNKITIDDNSFKFEFQPVLQRINENVLRYREVEYRKKEKLTLVKSVTNNNNSFEEYLTSYYNVFWQAKGEIGSLATRIKKTAYYNPSLDKTSDTTGSGNILIKGRPGSGKSTLALQMAVACTFSPNHYSSIYISFEETIRDIQIKARGFNWQDKLCPISYLDTIDEMSSPEEIGESLKKVMTQPDGCLFKQSDVTGIKENLKHESCEEHCDKTKQRLYEPRVFLPLLSPRGLFSEGQTHDDLFWERYRQLERLLTGIEYLNDHPEKSNGIPSIRMVCIDSLNVFGDERLTRNELFKLFDLFKSKGVIGVFAAEQESWVTKQPVGESIEDYLADIIIQLHMEDDSGYASRYFEITKSRYQHQVYGIHPLRLRGVETQRAFRKQFNKIDSVVDFIVDSFGPSRTLNLETLKNKIEEIKLEGSLKIGSDIVSRYTNKVKTYYYYYTLFKSQSSNKIALKLAIENIFLQRNTFFQPVTLQPSLHFIVYSTEMQHLSKYATLGIGSFRIGCDKLIPYHKQNLAQGSIVTIKGPRSTYKTNIAHNFLLDGLHCQENVLLIAFKERSSVNLTTEKKIKWMRERDKGDDYILNEERYYSLEDPKRIYNVYKCGTGYPSPYLIELALKGGALQPEELLEFVRDILREKFGNKPISRVVLDDVALIGSSYPYLRKSKTSGELFLAAFTHIMKNYNTNLLITGTTGQMKEADEMVDRACELSDSVLSCDFCDVFGDRYVTVSGDGMHSLSSNIQGQDVVPAVIMVDNSPPFPKFTVDTELLQGLVGFGTPHIYRPGLRLYTFKEGRQLLDYNRELQIMLSSSLGISWRDNYESVSSTEKQGAVPIPHSKPQNQEISVVSFDSTMSSALHDSLDLLKNKPIDSTVIYTIDEFWLCPDSEAESNDAEHRQITSSFHDISDISGKSNWHNDFKELTEHNIKQIIPYYGNVMLIAYRNDLKDKLPAEGDLSWTDLIETYLYSWNPNPGSRIEVPFCIDSSAPETLACLMLDSLSKNIWDASRKKDVKRNNPANKKSARPKYQFKANFTITEDSDQFKNIGAIQQILSRSYSDEKNIANDEYLKPKLKKNVMHPYAGVYICWYSQLREMIHAYPDLATKLDVCSMPGGGIRGDWYLGVAKGSVSLQLGKRVLHILTSKKEQYKRFSMGVGLPTLQEFYGQPEHPLGKKDFFAWQNANHVDLEKLMAIHSKGRCRAQIPRYKEFRALLYTIGNELINKNGDKMNNSDLNKIVSRIQVQYNLLVQKPG